MAVTTSQALTRRVPGMQVPDGLRPIRTKSAENEEALREAAARAEADLASQYGAAKPGGRAYHHAGPHMKNSAATGVS